MVLARPERLQSYIRIVSGLAVARAGIDTGTSGSCPATFANNREWTVGDEPGRLTRNLTIPRHDPVNAFTLGGIVAVSSATLASLLSGFASCCNRTMTPNPSFEPTAARVLLAVPSSLRSPAAAQACR